MDCSKYFNETKQLCKHFEDEDLTIKDRVRVFRKKNSEDGYDEVFTNNLQNLFGGISKQISFIFPHKMRAYNNRIGFRYYEDDPLKNNKSAYFTLVNVGERKFKILEKEEMKINDEDGNNFIQENLDCLAIMINIIKNKIDIENFVMPDTAAEILGFIYAAKIINKDKIIVIDPFYPSPFIKETLIEKLPKDLTSKLIIEPILFYKHVSLLLINYELDENNTLMRENYLFDMSGSHFKHITKSDPVFSKFMKRNLEIFPKKIMQFGNSCSLWFYASLLALLENENNISLPPDDKILSLTIDKLYDLCKIKSDFVDIENDEETNNSQKEKNKNEKVSLCSSYKRFVSYQLVFSSFLNVKGYILNFYVNYYGTPDYLSRFQKLFYNLKKRICLYKLNQEYYRLVFKKELFKETYFKFLEEKLEKGKKFFKQLIIEIKNRQDSLLNSNSLIPINEKIKSLERSIFDLESNFACGTLILYEKEELHKFYFENEDIYLEFFDN